MSDENGEVWTDCPNCGDEIPFFATVDGENLDEHQDEMCCPECGKGVDELFDMAISSQPIEPATPEPALQTAVTDGGHNE